MKSVRGGACAVCSQGTGGTCSGYTFSKSKAKAMVNEFNNNNPDPSNPYTYYHNCN